MPDNVALIHASMCANPQLAPSITLFPLGLGPDNTTCWVVAGDGNKGDGFAKCGPQTAQEAESFFSEGYHARGNMLVRKLDDLMHEDVKVGGSNLIAWQSLQRTNLAWPAMHGIGGVLLTILLLMLVIKQCMAGRCTLVCAAGPQQQISKRMHAAWLQPSQASSSLLPWPAFRC